MARQRREARARLDRLTLIEQMRYRDGEDVDRDREVWATNRGNWFRGNLGTAPGLFWALESVVPDDLRSGAAYAAAHGLDDDEIDRRVAAGAPDFVDYRDGTHCVVDDELRDAREAWLMERGGDWRALIEADDA